MNVLVLPPGIKTVPPDALPGLKPDIAVLLNPIYQSIAAEQLWPSAEFITENELADENDFEPLNEAAKSMAREWYLNTSVRRMLDEKGINLGGLFVRELTYGFLGILKAVYLWDRILKKYPQSDLFLYADGGLWTEAGHLTAKASGKEILAFEAPKKPKAPAKDFKKDFLKGFFQRINAVKVRNLKPGGVLFSAALRYCEPFMEAGRNDYYLRDIFSYKAFRDSGRRGFYHLTPEYFESAGAEAGQDYGPKLDEIFSAGKFFTRFGYNLWPLAKTEILRCLSDLPQIRRWIGSFFVLLEKTSPSAVILDEDVCVFNRALVMTANQFGIPTFVLVHGVPYFDVGFLPPAARRMLVWGPSTRRRLTEWGVEPERIIETGAPQYENFPRIQTVSKRSKVFKAFALNPESKLLVLALMLFHTNERPDFMGTPASPEFLGKIVRSALDYLEKNPGFSLIVKFHPRDKHAFFIENIIAQCPETVRKRVRTTLNYDTPSLIAACDVLLSTGSTVYFEGLLLGKPSLIYDDPDKRYFSFMSRDFLNVNDPASAAAAIDAALAHTPEADLSDHFLQKNARAKENILEILHEPQAAGSR